MPPRRNSEQIDIPEGQQNPLDYALSQRDRDVLDMVSAALQHDEVMLAYQPVMEAQRHTEVAFYEGLIRVLDPTGRVIPARQFITQVETRALGREIDCIALSHGLRALEAAPDLRLSINMSARSIGYGKWQDTLQMTLNRTPEVAERLILELSAQSVMMLPELVTSFMTETRRHGIAFALDDFGAGPIHLRHLRDIPFDALKIDPEFCHNIASSAANQPLVHALIAMATQMDILCVAEGVEKSADAQWLSQAGISCLQGYYFGAPTIRPPWLKRPRMAG